MTDEIERRIVEMQFENEQFEKGARQSLSTLEKLDNFLDNMGAAGVDKISGALDELTYRFSSFGIAGAEAVRKVTDRVIGLAANMIRAVPEQIISGGLNRAFNLEEAQFRLEGLGAQWEHIKDDMEYAVNETAYGLDEAAQAASILAGAQIDWTNNVEGASDMAHALRAISGVAAMTGSSYSDIAAVLTDVAAAGRVTGDVITRLAYRGMNVTAALAKGMGKSQAEIQKMFDEGTLSVVDFYRAMDKAFGEHATEANKTYSGSLMNINAALSRIGADFITPMHKNLIPINNSLREMFNRLRKVTQPFAEGTFTFYLEKIQKKLVPIIDNIKFDKVKTLLDWVSKLFEVADRGIDKVTDFIKRIREFFAETKDSENPMDAFKEWENFDKGHRLQKLRNFFKGMKETLRLVSGILQQVWGTLNRMTGGLLGKFADKLLNAGDAFGKFMGDAENIDRIYRKVKEFLSKVEQFGFKVRHNVGLAVSIVWESLKKIWNYLKDIGIFQKLGSILGWIGDKILYASDKLGTFLENVLTSIREGSALDTLRVIFGGIGDAIGTAFNTLKEFGAYLFGLKEGETFFDKYGDTLGSLFDTIKKIAMPVLEDISKAFHKFFNGEDNPLQFAVKLVAAIWGLRKIENMQWGFERAERGVGALGKIFGKDGLWNYIKENNPLEWVDKIGTVLKRLAGALRSFSNKVDAQALLTIGGAVLMLALGTSILANIEEEDMEGFTRGLHAMITIVGVLIIALYSLSRIINGGILKNIEKNWMSIFSVIGKSIGNLMNAFALKEAAKSLLYFAAAVLILVVAVGALAFILTKTKPEVFWQAVGAVAALAGMLILMVLAMGYAMKAVNGFDSLGFLAIGGVLISAALAILALAGAVAIFANIASQEGGLDALRAGIDAIIVLAAVLGVLIVALSKFASGPEALAATKAMKNVAWSFLIIAGAMWVLGEALTKFQNMQWQTIAAGLASLMSVALVLSLMAKYNDTTKGLTSAAWALMITAAAMRILVGAFSAFDKVIEEDPTSFFMFVGLLGAMTIALIALSNVSATVSASATALIKVAAAMLIASVAVAALGLAVMTYENTSIDAVINMGLTLAAVGIAFKLISEALNPKDIAVAALSLMLAAIALAGIGIAMQLFEGIKMDDVASMFMTILGIALVAALLGTVGKEALIGALALAAIGLSMLLVAPGLKKFGEALPALADGLKAFEGISLAEIGAALGGAVVTALFAMLGLPFLAFGAKGVEVLIAFGGALPILAAGIAAFGQVSGWDLVKLLGGVATGIGSILAIKLARNGVNDFYTVAVGLEKIANAITTLPTDAGEILKSFAKALKDFAPEAYNALADVLNHMGNIMNNEQRKQNWITYGGNISRGIANGIARDAHYAYDNMNRLANSLQRSFTVSLAIRSPSRVFERLAEYIPQAIAIGIQNGESEVTNAMMSSMSGAVSYMEQIGKNTSNYAPSIRPVMDLGGMRSSMLYADRMFSGSSLGRMGNISGLHVNGDNISYSMQNKDVVTELQILEERIGKLGQAIENLQLVMDTGVVVGALAPQMNSQLGTYAVRERRQ